MEWIGSSSSEQSAFTPSSTPNSSLEPAKMILGYFSNDFPHDDLKDLLRHLHVHSKDIRYPTLARFIHQATLAIHEEVRLLPATLRMLVPSFETVFNLVDHSTLRNGPLGGAVDGMLLCVLQLATFIGQVRYENGLDEDLCHSFSVDTYLAGLGTGLLSTAAVSLSSSLTDMPLAGAEVVRLAFRLGILVDEVSQNLQPRQVSEAGPGDSWAYVVPDVTADEVRRELDAIHKTEKIHEASKIFISALSQTSVTVSGPPARLKHIFLKSSFFRDRRSVVLPVYAGLCHAKHVYDKDHVNSIIQTSSLDSLDAKLTPRLPIFSTSTGRPFSATSAKELFRKIIEEILTQAIQWDNLVQGIVQLAKDVGASECQLLVFRTSVPIHDLVTALNSDLEQSKITTKDLIPWITRSDARPSKANGAAQSKIAIVGMSCRMPGGADNTEKFWQLLESGLDVHRRIPADRFDVDSHYDPSGKRINTSHTPYGCFIDEPGLFDAPFFNMSPREAEQTDPMQRLALVTAYEALERAGYVANRTAATRLERVGTFYGQASDDYREVNTAQEVSTYFIPGGCRAFGPGRINYFFKFAGPSYSIDSACSSSLTTIQSACTALWNSELDTAVVGGMNVLTNSDAFAGLSHGHFLSKTSNACKTWDSEADGYCRADAVASLVMKRLEDAQADNDNILGVILSAGTNHSANAISITHPHAGHQAYLGRHVLNKAGVNPLDVGYVEMHGTGTQAGDAEEIQSVTDVFAPNAGGKRRSAKSPLYIGAVKANVGHSEAAAGVTAVLKVLLMLQKNAIAPHVGIKNSLNPLFPKFIDGRNVQIPYQKVEWPRLPSGRKRIAMVNNFSAAGGNTTLALEEGPLRAEVRAEEADPRPTHIIAVSAKSKVSLRGNIERLLGFLNADADTLSSLEHLSYTMTARRFHHNHRVAFAASDVSQVKKHLHSALGHVDSHKPISSSTGPPHVAFVFTGQGASHKSYNLEMFHHCPSFRTQTLHLDKLACSLGFPSFLPVLDGSHAQDYLHPAVMSQLALVCVEMALFKYWASLNVRPDVVVGHSLGEYAALNAAGVLSASDAIYLVGQRARLLELKCQAGSHKMVAVRASVEQIETSLTASGAPYEVACLNGPNDSVLSGPAANMEAAMPLLEKEGYKCFILDVPFAFHSAQTDPVLDEFEDLAVSGVLFQPPQLPIISPLLDKVIFDEKTVNAKYMRRATRESVNFLAALRTAHNIGTIDDDTAWIEIGPHPVCVNLIKSSLGRTASQIAVPSFRRGESNWKTLADSIATLHCAGVNIEWNEFHGPFEKGLRLLDIPTYAWNEKNHWIQYNGDWALTKGNHFYDEEKGIGAFAKSLPEPGSVSSLSTSTIGSVLEESFRDTAGTVLIQSDLSQRDFRAAVWGHKMNNCGVVTSSIHADIAFTLGNYLYKKLRPHGMPRDVNITNLEVLKGLVANSNPDTPQLIQVRVSTENIDSNMATLIWYNVREGMRTEEPFATATLLYDTATVWLSSWIPTTHLIQGRIQELERLADAGLANRLSNSMAYQLFASNLVDYAAMYRGMQSVVLYGLEAFAEVTLATDGLHSGNYTVPPCFIDSVAHLAGFVMNVSDALDTGSKYAVTPGWRSLRFAKPLVPGGKYRSYVKMIPTEDDPTVFFGDVYVLQDGQIMGMCEGIQFRRYPRILLSRFFSAPDDPHAPPVAHATKAVTPTKVTPPAATAVIPTLAIKSQAAPPPAVHMVAIEPSSTPAATVASSLHTTVAVEEAATPANIDSTSAKAIGIVASEAALDLTDLTDDASFAELGVDSLMSLVIAEKFREQLGVVVNGSLFLEYPTIGDLRSWLDEYYT